MRAIRLIVMREVKERLGATSFRFFTLGLLLMAAGSVVAIDQARNIFGENEYRLGVVGEVPADLGNALEGAGDAQEVSVVTVRVSDLAEAELLLDGGEIDAALIDDRLIYESSEVTTLTAVVNRALYIARLPDLLEESGISTEQAEELLNPEPAQVQILTEEETNAAARQFIGFIAALTFYITLAIYGNWILTGVVEEKASRIVEVLLGLLRPQEILTGKTLGIVLVALLQLSMALFGAAAALVLVGTDVLPSIALDVVLASIPLFIMGVLLYALLYAAVGSTVVRQSDAQSASTPIVMILLVPYMFASIFVPGNPDGPASTFLSIFPLTSPLVMPARIATGSPGVIELALCYGLMLPAIAFVAWLGGRIYSASILNGRKVTLRRLLSAAFGSRSREAPTI